MTSRIVAGLLLAGLCWETAPATTALAQDGELGAEEGPEPAGPNAVSAKPAYAVHFLRDRPTRVPDDEPPEIDHLVGFVPTYVRTFIPGRLALQVSKPFFFSGDRFDSPLEVLLAVSTRAGRFEPFLAFGPTLNIRVFQREREEVEGRRVELSLGLTAAAGVSYVLSPHWLLELEVSYSYVVEDAVVAQELNVAFGPAYVF